MTNKLTVYTKFVGGKSYTSAFFNGKELSNAEAMSVLAMALSAPDCEHKHFNNTACTEICDKFTFTA